MTIDDKNEIDDFTEFELDTYTKNMLISIATGGEQDAKIYEYTRSKFIESSLLSFRSLIFLILSPICSQKK